MIPWFTPFAALLATFAIDPVGAWTGKLQLKLPRLPPNLPPDRRALAARAAEKIKSGRIDLTLRADHSFAVRIVNLPSMGPSDTRGAWSQRGRTVTLHDSTPGIEPQNFVLSADGRTMSYPIQNAFGAQGRLVFSR